MALETGDPLMTSLFYSKEEKSLFTDSFTAVNLEDGTRAGMGSGYHPNFAPPTTRMVHSFEEKIYKDPDNRFILTVLGNQLWIGEGSKNFQLALNFLIPFIKAHESGNEVAFQKLNQLKVFVNGQDENLPPKLRYRSEAPEESPPIPKEQYVLEGVNDKDETLDLIGVQEFCCFGNMILITNKAAYSLSGDNIVELATDLFKGGDEYLYTSLSYLGLSKRRAYELCVKHAHMAGGTIHQYKQEDLTAFDQSVDLAPVEPAAPVDIVLS